MKVGSKSLIFGAHCFFLHPIFVARAWINLYGWPRHPAIWLAFLVHDWGYWQKSAMDSADGEEHPEFGARIVGWFFGPEWYRFTRYHSRYLAKRDGVQYSQLCVADKLAFGLTPRWLYLPMVKLSGEIKEYMGEAAKLSSIPFDAALLNPWSKEGSFQCWRWWWFVEGRMTSWAYEHRDLGPDNRTRVRHEPQEANQ